MKKTTVAGLVLALAAGTLAPAALAQAYPPATDPTPSRDRLTVTVSRAEVGNSRAVDDATVVALCGDLDGCTVRLGMFNWDGNGLVASRQALLFLNTANRRWRVDAADASGRDGDGVVQHVLNAFGCYFTDATYKDRAASDTKVGFELLTWTTYSADCWLTIAD